jgi:hypothetical protein
VALGVFYGWTTWCVKWAAHNDLLWLLQVISIRIVLNNSIKFFIIYVLSQQPQGQLQAQHSVDKSSYILDKQNVKSKTNYRQALEENTLMHIRKQTKKIIIIIIIIITIVIPITQIYDNSNSKSNSNNYNSTQF